MSCTRPGPRHCGSDRMHTSNTRKHDTGSGGRLTRSGRATRKTALHRRNQHSPESDKLPPPSYLTVGPLLVAPLVSHSSIRGACFLRSRLVLVLAPSSGSDPPLVVRLAYRKPCSLFSHSTFWRSSLRWVSLLWAAPTAAAAAAVVVVATAACCAVIACAAAGGIAARAIAALAAPAGSCAAPLPILLSSSSSPSSPYLLFFPPLPPWRLLSRAADIQSHPAEHMRRRMYVI